MRKAQVSVEYLIMIGISLAILIPASVFFLNYSQSSNNGVVRSQVNKIGSLMIINSEQIYSLAEGSSTTLELKFPESIKKVYILNNRELVFEYELSSGITEAVFFSNVDMSFNYNYTDGTFCSDCIYENSQIVNLTPGIHNIKISSKTSYVFLEVNDESD